MAKLEYFVVKPSIKTFGGIRVTKETEFETYNDDETIHQTMKDLVLTTEIKKETEFNGIKSTENSSMTTTMPEGTIIVWSEETGYIIPNYSMVTPKEAVEILSKIEEITTPIVESNKGE